MGKSKVIKIIKQRLPENFQNFLKPYYSVILRFYRSRKSNDFGARNWGLDISIPFTHRYKFKKSILMGVITSIKETKYTNIILCAQPKSASLYMVNLLSHSLSLSNHQVGFDEKGGSIYYPRLLATKYITGNTISHCHAEPSPLTIKMIESLNFRPLILTRNLLDTIVSRRDMLLRDKWAGNMLSREAISKFIEGTDEYQLDVVIDLFADSYINFNAGWNQLRSDKKIRPYFITYQEMIDDEVGLVLRVANHLGIEVSSEHVRVVSTKIKLAGGINFSKGVAGRGKNVLTKEHISTLRKKASILGCSDELFLGFKPG